jgi:ribosomal protein S24E
LTLATDAFIYTGVERLYYVEKNYGVKRDYGEKMEFIFE